MTTKAAAACRRGCQRHIVKAERDGHWLFKRLLVDSAWRLFSFFCLAAVKSFVRGAIRKGNADAAIAAWLCESPRDHSGSTATARLTTRDRRSPTGPIGAVQHWPKKDSFSDTCRGSLAGTLQKRRADVAGKQFRPADGIHDSKVQRVGAKVLDGHRELFLKRHEE
jgi:hypothetical protein